MSLGAQSVVAPAAGSVAPPTTNSFFPGQSAGAVTATPAIAAAPMGVGSTKEEDIIKVCVDLCVYVCL
jgi:hypothetical protein